MPPTGLAKGKVVAGYSLPEKLVVHIATKAVKERKRPCHIVERLLARGLEAEAAEAKAAATT